MSLYNLKSKVTQALSTCIANLTDLPDDLNALIRAQTEYINALEKRVPNLNEIEEHFDEVADSFTKLQITLGDTDRGQWNKKTRKVAEKLRELEQIPDMHTQVCVDDTRFFGDFCISPNDVVLWAYWAYDEETGKIDLKFGEKASLLLTPAQTVKEIKAWKKLMEDTVFLLEEYSE